MVDSWVVWLAVLRVDSMAGSMAALLVDLMVDQRAG